MSTHNLPLQLSSFIGREREIAELKHLLVSARLVTLTGVGGSGKTRLAIAVGASLADARLGEGQPRPYADGIWFIELASLADPSLVPQKVAATLDVREQPGQPLLATLTNYLRDKHLLLVLDNCEHLIEACAQFAEAVLQACAHVSILATSREALNIAGEVIFLVPQLSSPAVGTTVQLLSQQMSVEELKQYEAVQLFAARATAAHPRFALTTENARAVAHICHQLDGIPLAIELAAARVRAMSVEQIAARLDDSINLLAGGSRTAPPRHQTLRAALDWSHELLSEPERVLFRRLSVFAGGWTLEAAESVCSKQEAESSGGTLPTAYRILPSDVLDLLTQLVNKSLVLLEEKDVEARYRMLEPIRQYAREKLMATGESEQTQAHHLEFFMQFALTAGPAVERPNLVASLNRLETEHDNLRAALSWALERDDSDSALRLGGALAEFWFVRGHSSEGWQWLQRALAMSRHAAKESPHSRALRSTALAKAGDLLMVQGDLAMRRALAEEGLALSREVGDKRDIAYALDLLGLVAHAQSDDMTARALFQESLALSREVGDKSRMAFSLEHLGLVAHAQSDDMTARALFQESLALSHEVGDKRRMANSRAGLGLVAYAQSDYATARALHQESLTLYHEVGDKRAMAYELDRLGFVAHAQGDDTTARALFQESLALSHKVGDKRRMAGSLLGLGLVAHAQGDDATARALFQNSLALAREVGYKQDIVNALNKLGHLALVDGDYAAARVEYAESLTLMSESGNKLGIAYCLVGWANLAHAIGHLERATKLCGSVEGLLQAMNARLEPPEREIYERNVAAVRAQLDEATSAKLWAEGRAMTMEQAIAEAERMPTTEETELSTQTQTPTPTYPAGLTKREVEVLRWLAKGLTNAEIAEQLVVSQRTIHAHLRSIYGKLDVTTRSAATRAAIDLKLV